MESKQELNSSKSSKDSFTVDETLLEEELSVKPHIPPQIFMPPPAPLQPKDALPCEPIHTGFQIPFVRLPKFEGTEQLWDQAPEITQEERRAADCHAPELTLRSLFEFDTNIVYRRKQMSKLNQSADFYNANLCNVRKLVKGKKRKNTTLHDNLEPYYTKTSAADNTLIFESRFETGNLEKAVKIQSNEYNLLLQNDINSKGHTQWFFFRVQNTRKNASIKFNIVNFVKKDSLYNHGMKILIYSEKLAELTGEGWFRGGEDIKYFANGMKRQDRVVYKSYHTLTFKYKFQFTGDTIYFANSFPYTYTQLQDYLTEIQEDPEKSPFCNVKPL